MYPQDENPFASPFDGRDESEAADVGAIHPGRVAAGDVLNHALSAFRRYWGPLLGAVLITIAVDYAIRVAGLMVATAVFRVPGQQLPIPWIPVGRFTFSPLELGFWLMQMCVGVFLQIGVSRMMLSAARDRPPRIEQLFSGGPWFIPVLLTGLLFGLGLSIGLALLIIPGLLVALTFWPYRWLIIDNKTDALESFGVARTITDGNWGTAVLLFLVSVGIAFLGLLACFCGLFVAIPLISLMWGTAYLMMSGQIGYRPQAYVQPQSDYGYGTFDN